MDLVKKENAEIILRHYGEEDLNRMLLMNLMPYVSNILSLTDEVSADRLEIALPAIKEHCIGMGFDEIKKMFDNYADGRMKIQPIPNYFDRILLGKIVNEWKSTRKVKKVENKITMSDTEINKIMDEAIEAGKAEYILNPDANITNASSRFDWLDEQGLVQKTLGYTDEGWKVKKKEVYDSLKVVLAAEAKNKKATSFADKIELKKLIKNIESEKSGEVVLASKQKLLKMYYQKNLKS